MKVYLIFHSVLCCSRVPSGKTCPEQCPEQCAEQCLEQHMQHCPSGRIRQDGSVRQDPSGRIYPDGSIPTDPSGRIHPDGSVPTDPSGRIHPDGSVRTDPWEKRPEQNYVRNVRNVRNMSGTSGTMSGNNTVFHHTPWKILEDRLHFIRCGCKCFSRRAAALGNYCDQEVSIRPSNLRSTGTSTCISIMLSGYRKILKNT